MQSTFVHRRRFGWATAALLLPTVFTLLITLVDARQVATPPADSSQVSLGVAFGEPQVQAAAASVGDDGSPDREGGARVERVVESGASTQPEQPVHAAPAEPTTWTVVDDLNAVCDE